MIKKIATAAAAVSMMFSGAASAADMAVKARPAVAPVYTYNWSGCYVGAEAGGAWGRGQTRLATTNEKFQDPFDLSGGVAGGEIGCNFQAGQFVIGVEGDWSWANKKGNAFDGNTAGNPTIPISLEERWLSTGRVRVGYAWDRVLLFASGGFAAADVRWTGSLLPPTFATAFTSSDTTRMTGWVAGVGLEYGITDNWSVKGEYLHVDLGSATVCGATCPTPFGPFAARSISVTNDIVRVGVNYRWNWASPVVARY